MRRSLPFLFGLLFSLRAPTSAGASPLPGRRTLQASYCDGWSTGWKEGWKFEKGTASIPPIAPICPVPEIGRSTYRDGYNRGLVAGQQRASAQGGPAAPSMRTNSPNYCDGWKLGWGEGWKYVKGKLSLAPIAPICPIPEVGRGSYQDGYNRGFVAGQRQAGG